jgi:hypothetical protein
MHWFCQATAGGRDETYPNGTGPECPARQMHKLKKLLKILTCERGVARTGSETNLQGSIPCDTAGARKPDLAVGISNGYRSFARGTLKSMSSRKGVIEKGRGFDSPQSPVIVPSSCPLFGTQRTFPDVTANLYSS